MASSWIHVPPFDSATSEEEAVAGASPRHAPGADGRVLGIVVTFHPPGDFALRARQMALLFDTLLVFDNTPGANGGRLTGLSTPDAGNVQVLGNGENRGMGFALESGLDYAVRHGYRWLVTLDQDTRLPEGYRVRMAAVLARYASPERIGTLAPVYRLTDGRVLKFAGKRPMADTPWVEIDVSMTSATWVNVVAAREVGGFDPKLFIDYVDVDFALRLRRGGFVNLETDTVIVEHDLGSNMTHRRVLGRMVGIPNYPPSRVYYQTRNRILVYRRYWRSSPGYVIGDLLRLPWVPLKILLFESGKAAKLRAWIRGGVDGLRGKSGAVMHRG